MCETVVLALLETNNFSVISCNAYECMSAYGGASPWFYCSICQYFKSEVKNIDYGIGSATYQVCNLALSDDLFKPQFSPIQKKGNIFSPGSKDRVNFNVYIYCCLQAMICLIQ